MDGLNVNEYWPYAQCYCEENTYRFLEKFAVDPPQPTEGAEGAAPVPRKYESWAAFITSYSEKPGEEVAPGEWQSSVPVVAGPRATDIVYWDYHCVAVVKETTPAESKDAAPKTRWWVVDYDTKLGKQKHVTPMPMELYFGVTLSAAGKNAVAMLAAKVRFVPATEFLQKFRSDRRHMYLRSITKENRYRKMTPFALDNPANFQHPPPKLPRIQGPSPAAGAIRGDVSKAAARDAIATEHGLAEDSKKAAMTNKHSNNLAAFLNTQNTTVCKSDLVGIKEIGQWIKAHE